MSVYFLKATLVVRQGQKAMDLRCYNSIVDEKIARLHNQYNNSYSYGIMVDAYSLIILSCPNYTYTNYLAL